MSYNEKHNEANGEGNRDGNDDNLSWNCGVGGPDRRPGVEALRERQIKNFATLLMLSRGVPMFVAGDEIRRTQQGNNNAYCQDNEISWFDWSLARPTRTCCGSSRTMHRVPQRATPCCARREFFTGAPNSRGLPDSPGTARSSAQPGLGRPEGAALAFTLGGVATTSPTCT